MKNKKILKLALVFSIFATVAFSAAGFGQPVSLNIAVVDVNVFQQQFLEEVNVKLQSKFGSRQAEIQKMVDKFKADQEKFQKDSKIISAKKLDELKQSLMKQQDDLQREAQKFESDLASVRDDELKIKLNDLMKVVSTISSQNKYDMVLAKNVALFVGEKFDITEQVKKEYDKSNKSNVPNKQ
jgi:Skp family chaperone for outer membrane proteins